MSGSTTGLKRGLGSYLRLLRTPGAAPLALWGVLGRLPIGMRPISCILLVSSVTGSLGYAGAVAAAMLVSQGLVSPVLGRLADRFSQRRVLITAGTAHAVGMALLLVVVRLEAPLWLMIVTAVAPGCTSVSFTSFMRARWTVMVEKDMLRTAFAMETILDDVIFLMGPLLVTVLITAVHPAAGLIACALLTFFGSIAVALHSRSEPASASTAGRRPTLAISVPGVWVMMAVYAGMGFQFGALDVTLIAFAEQRDTPGLSGVLLALTAVGSLAAGAVYGAVNWRRSERRLLVLTSCLLPVSAVPLAFASSFPVMAALAVLAGVAIAPGMIAGSTVLESLAPRGSLSEAFSWLTCTGAMGIAAGTGAGGQLADLSGFPLAAWAAACGGLVALVLSVGGQPALRPRSTSPSPQQAVETAVFGAVPKQGQ
ncbi:MFS transporter [Streptomyces sparsus]